MARRDAPDGRGSPSVLLIRPGSLPSGTVVFGADAPHVADGIEYYDIDFATGDLEYGLSPA